LVGSSLGFVVGWLEGNAVGNNEGVDDGSKVG